MKDNLKPAKIVAIEALRDEAATLFGEAADVEEALNQWKRKLLSNDGLIERLESLAADADSLARRRIYNIPDSFEGYPDEDPNGHLPDGAA